MGMKRLLLDFYDDRPRAKRAQCRYLLGSNSNPAVERCEADPGDSEIDREIVYRKYLRRSYGKSQVDSRDVDEVLLAAAKASRLISSEGCSPRPQQCDERKLRSAVVQPHQESLLPSFDLDRGPLLGNPANCNEDSLERHAHHKMQPGNDLGHCADFHQQELFNGVHRQPLAVLDQYHSPEVFLHSAAGPADHYRYPILGPPPAHHEERRGDNEDFRQFPLGNPEKRGNEDFKHSQHRVFRHSGNPERRDHKDSRVHDDLRNIGHLERRGLEHSPVRHPETRGRDALKLSSAGHPFRDSPVMHPKTRCRAALDLSPVGYPERRGHDEFRHSPLRHPERRGYDDFKHLPSHPDHSAEMQHLWDPDGYDHHSHGLFLDQEVADYRHHGYSPAQPQVSISNRLAIQKRVPVHQRLVFPDKQGEYDGQIYGGENAENAIGDPLEGMIFGCTSLTKQECERLKLFGLPASNESKVLRVTPGTPLFLFNYETKRLSGVYEAKSYGALNILPNAFAKWGSFPAQVKVDRVLECPDLPFNVFKKAILENFYTDKRFEFDLTASQVEKLLNLFAGAGDTAESARL